MLLFHEILMIKESYNLICPEHFGPQAVKQNFSRYGVCTGKQGIVRSFMLGYFQQKVIKKIMQTQENSTLCWATFRIKYSFAGKSNPVTFICFLISITEQNFRKK